MEFSLLSFISEFLQSFDLTKSNETMELLQHQYSQVYASYTIIFAIDLSMFEAIATDEFILNPIQVHLITMDHLRLP